MVIPSLFVPRFLAAALLFPLLPATSPAASPAPPKLIGILSAELDRNFKALKEKGDPQPYFMSYSVTEEEGYSVNGTSGFVSAHDTNRVRVLDVSVRLGKPAMDNYHRVPRDFAQFTRGSALSLDDNADAIRRRLWLDTDSVYRSAAQRLIRLKTSTQVKLDASDPSPDFSPAPTVVAYDQVPEVKFNMVEYEKKARKWSAMFKEYPAILNSNVSITAQRESKYFVNTEGTSLLHGRTFARVVIVARTKASDGMDLVTSETLEADDPSGLPADKQVEAAIQKAATEITRLLDAPEVEPFVGPAILSGKAAGVFFHEIFGHRVEGHRQKDEAEGQTFTKRVNEPVLPEFLSVIFDPTVKRLANTDLYGWYNYDDEGVRARRVPVVENGILKTFLLSRSPIAGFPASNGHGRRQPGAEVVSRQSNLIVDSAKEVDDKKLREMLIEEIKRQNKPYGLYFESVTGGFTTTGRQGLQAFTVMPLVVYRVYADGRKDELVRGVDIVGTPLASFAKIAATSNRKEVFNGYCGAESGQVPVSAISPALLVTEIEVQKKNKSQDKPPLLNRPPTDGGAE